ncbi:MAG: ATP-grasp domain-containing protein [Jatrophihabitantaceae bacterium]
MGNTSSTIRKNTPRTSPARLCFIVEDRYQHDAMPGEVIKALDAAGHDVDVLRPHSMLASLSRLDPIDGDGYDGYVLKTVSSGPGLSILEAAGAAGGVTINDYRSIRLARDKGVAASLARAAGLPFPKTYFAARSALVEQVPAEMYPLVVKPNNGSSCEQIFRIDNAAQLAGLDVDDDGFLLVQRYLPNPGYDVKLYNTGDEVFSVVRRSPLHPGADVTEQLVPMTAEWRKLALRVGRVFGLDIYGLDVIDTPHGWMILDINDFPGFSKVPDAAQRIANTIVRVTSHSQKPQQRVSTALHRKIVLDASA